MTTRTVAALFDSHADAERARSRLAQIGIPADMIDITDQEAVPRTASPSEPEGLWEKIKSMVMPETDRSEYEEGIRRGGSLLSAPVEDPLTEDAIATLEECHPIDIDQRRTEWGKSGWSLQPGSGTTAATSSSRDGIREEVIPVAEEQLRVGKREVSRGGMRVRSYVVEEPVQQNVRLRQEHVEIERRRASPMTSAQGDPLEERTVEMRETAEEPVVQKDTRVKEEVVVRKRAEEREQPVKGTVRRTKVEMEKDSGSDPGPGGTSRH